jgi:hypothetical protein
VRAAAQWLLLLAVLVTGAAASQQLAGGLLGRSPSGTGTAVALSTARWDGDGGTVEFTASATVSATVLVAVNGLVQDADAYAVVDSVLTMDVAPSTGETLTWAFYGTVASGTHIVQTLTANGTDVDFALSHAPASIVLVAANGLVADSTEWSLVQPQTIRFVSPPTGSVTVSYSY